MAKVVSDQMNHFAAMGRAKLAGHIVNLDFWLSQTRHALSVIDGHEERFQRLKATDSAYLYKALSEDVLFEARQSVSSSTYRFLLRCFHDGLISETQLRSACDSVGLKIDDVDLRKNRE